MTREVPVSVCASFLCYGPKEKRGAGAVRIAADGVTDQSALMSAARAAVRRDTSLGAESCSASATIRAAVVESRTADRPLWRFVQRRAWAWPASSAKITSPGGGGATPPGDRR